MTAGSRHPVRVDAGPRSARPAHQSASTADDQLNKLEARLARLEYGSRLRERSRSVMAQVLPAQATHHFRNAGREQLLGVRSILDFWIERVDPVQIPAHHSAKIRVSEFK